MMDSTIEVRSPLIALPIVRYAMSLPWNERQGKEILKKSALELGVPESIVNRKKVPLKSDGIRQDPIAHRVQLVNTWRSIFTQKGTM